MGFLYLMTRTKKGSKPPGFDYWGKRGSCPKDVTKASERMKAKQELLKEPTEPEYDPQEYITHDNKCPVCHECIDCEPFCLDTPILHPGYEIFKGKE